MREPTKGDSVVVDSVKCRIQEISKEIARCKPTYSTYEVRVSLDMLVWDDRAGLWRVR